MGHKISFYRFPSAERIHYRLDDCNTLTSIETGNVFRPNSYPKITDQFSDSELEWFLTNASNHKTFLRRLVQADNFYEVMQQACINFDTYDGVFCYCAEDEYCEYHVKCGRLLNRLRKNIEQYRPEDEFKHKIKNNEAVGMLDIICQDNGLMTCHVGVRNTGEIYELKSGSRFPKEDIHEIGLNKFFRVPLNIGLIKSMGILDDLKDIFRKVFTLRDMVLNAENKEVWKNILCTDSNCDHNCVYHKHACANIGLEKWEEDTLHNSLLPKEYAELNTPKSENSVMTTKSKEYKSRLCKLNCKHKDVSFRKKKGLVKINTRLQK